MIANSSDRLRRIAAAHVLTLEDASASEDSVLAALAWIEEDEEHFLLAREVAQFSQICDRMPATFVPVVELSEPPARLWQRHWPRWSIAAALALAMMGTAAVIVRTGLLSPQPAQESFEYFTEVGETKSVTLPDRTRVALGGASGIRVTYDRAFRRITLTSGEAFFDVTKDKDRPLIVATSDGQVTALGTAFNVNRMLDATTVTLLRGSVKVEAGEGGHAQAVLRPGTQVAFAHAGGLSPIRSVSGSSAVAWRDGRYRFDDAPLSAIVADLRRYHRKPIVLESAALGGLRFTGAVNLTSADIDQWLQGLQLVGGIKVSIGDQAVLVSQAPADGGG